MIEQFQNTMSLQDYLYTVDWTNVHAKMKWTQKDIQMDEEIKMF
jgi:hypothetical protein